MVTMETAIGVFVLVFMVVLMAVMVYMALGTEDAERTEPDDAAAEPAE